MSRRLRYRGRPLALRRHAGNGANLLPEPSASVRAKKAVPNRELSSAGAAHPQARGASGRTALRCIQHKRLRSCRRRWVGARESGIAMSSAIDATRPASAEGERTQRVGHAGTGGPGLLLRNACARSFPLVLANQRIQHGHDADKEPRTASLPDVDRSIGI